MNGSVWPHGQGKIKRYNASRWALLGAVAAAGAVMFAACGSVAAPGSDAGAGTHTAPAAAGAVPGTAEPALCRDTAMLTSLVITRTHGYKVPELQPAFPSQVPVTNRAVIQAVARALCALPVMPSGVYNCPAILLGTAYTLQFAAAGRPLPLVTVNSSGCRTVTGVGPVRRVTSPSFWQVLSRAIGARTPPVYGGVVPGVPCEPLSRGVTKISDCPDVARPRTGVADPAGVPAS
jgi:hypothetical protein